MPATNKTENGSSPLARGLRILLEGTRRSVGIIPARAGFTAGPARRSLYQADHPRSRGVYVLVSVRGAARQGSSPLARGLPHCRSSEWHGTRIIPARAGFTGPRQDDNVRRPDHPRSRGVYHIRTRNPPPQLRIIPARAGFTGRHHAHPRGHEDHPRSRGVYALIGGLPPGSTGSSPLARGLPILFYASRGQIRIIPARAGFTSGSAWPFCSLRDHPRSRGVYKKLRTKDCAVVGSSPLARGLPIRTVSPHTVHGIIPARAGFTSSAASARSRASGSSPLARGLRPSGRA